MGICFALFIGWCKEKHVLYSIFPSLSREDICGTLSLGVNENNFVIECIAFDWCWYHINKRTFFESNNSSHIIFAFYEI